MCEDLPEFFRLAHFSRLGDLTAVVARGRFDPEHRDAQLADHPALFARARAVYQAL